MRPARAARYARVAIVVGLFATACSANTLTGRPSATGTSQLSSAPSTAAPTSSTRPATSASSRPSTSASSRPSTTAASPPSTLPAWLSGREWTRIPTSKHVVALSFDAGADAAGLPSILATLSREHATGTFFLTGTWADRYRTQAHDIATRGYRIGDHSMTHPHFTQLSDAQQRAQVNDAAATIRRVTGVSPAPLFRFPFGDRNAHTISVVNADGYAPIAWTVDTLGWQGTSGGRSTASVTRRVLDNLQPGEIVLMHVGANPDDGSTLDADALPAIIAAVRSAGYTFVTLDALVSAQ